jgi:hypothetical protein
MEKEKLINRIHDLNSTLCACSGLTERLLNVEDRDYSKKILGTIYEGLLKMGVALDDIKIELLKEQRTIESFNIDLKRFND